VSFARRDTIKKEDVELMVEGDTGETIFALTDAVSNGQQVKALELLNAELARGTNELYLLTMIVRQFRILWMIKGALEEGLSGQDAIARQLELHPFVVKKGLTQARKYSIAQLKKIHARLLDIDVKLKTTPLSPELLFNLFVVDNQMTRIL